MNILNNILLFILMGFVIPLIGMERRYSQPLPVAVVKAAPGQLTENLDSYIAKFERQLKTVNDPIYLITQIKPFVEGLINHRVNIVNISEFSYFYDKIQRLLVNGIPESEFLHLLQISIYNCYQSIIRDVKNSQNQYAVDVKGRIFEILALLVVYQDPITFGKVINIGLNYGTISEIDILTDKYLIEVKAANQIYNAQTILNQIDAHSECIQKNQTGPSLNYLIFCAQDITTQNYIHLLDEKSNFSHLYYIKKLKTIYFYTYETGKISSFPFRETQPGNEVNLEELSTNQPPGNKKNRSRGNSVDPSILFRDSPRTKRRTHYH